ncbi:hypothetical protein EDB81DRAFT_18975 [Dactylonectria macrodidyma]|uniref:Uncharacterized protein n=1 Tax=Dactylonectria macrodidyma TaxID=307937 RepID=A0A9P9FT54_9HYPO|nr:hypothetical protein EDB81DRAFT_18975 [Dactylonectria macrodidyma]
MNRFPVLKINPTLAKGCLSDFTTNSSAMGKDVTSRSAILFYWNDKRQPCSRLVAFLQVAHSVLPLHIMSRTNVAAQSALFFPHLLPMKSDVHVVSPELPTGHIKQHSSNTIVVEWTIDVTEEYIVVLGRNAAVVVKRTRHTDLRPAIITIAPKSTPCRKGYQWRSRSRDLYNFTHRRVYAIYSRLQRADKISRVWSSSLRECHLFLRGREI